MARFSHLATQPARGPSHILRWKVLDRLPGRRAPRVANHAELDRVRPGVRDDGARAFAEIKGAAACWIGHASWVLRLGGKHVALDPIWSQRIQGVVPRLVPPGVALDALPKFDVVCITHDHMDHMDLATLARIGKGPRYVVPLGNAARLKKMGLEDVVELDWWQSCAIGDVEITLVPARHWSMRAPWTRNETLWGGYVLRGPEGTAYHSGDTAGGSHFGDIAARLGAIDWAMLPIGSYEPRWFMISQHMNPDDAA
jgi:L-ascorbate metabolism protein UlaG (beta-lactamase superfamily)